MRLLCSSPFLTCPQILSQPISEAQEFFLAISCLQGFLQWLWVWAEERDQTTMVGKVSVWATCSCSLLVSLSLAHVQSGFSTSISDKSVHGFAWPYDSVDLTCLMMDNHARIVTWCLMVWYRHSVTVLKRISETIFQKAYNYPVYMAWPSSRTLGSFCDFSSWSFP